MLLMSREFKLMSRCSCNICCSPGVSEYREAEPVVWYLTYDWTEGDVLMILPACIFFRIPYFIDDPACLKSFRDSVFYWSLKFILGNKFTWRWGDFYFFWAFSNVYRFWLNQNLVVITSQPTPRKGLQSIKINVLSSSICFFL